MFKWAWDEFCRDLRVHPAVAVLSIVGLFALAILMPLALRLLI